VRFSHRLQVFDKSSTNSYQRLPGARSSAVSLSKDPFFGDAEIHHTPTHSVPQISQKWKAPSHALTPGRRTDRANRTPCRAIVLYLAGLYLWSFRAASWRGDEALRCPVVVHEFAEEAQELGFLWSERAGFCLEAVEGFRVDPEGKAGAFGHGLNCILVVSRVGIVRREMFVSLVFDEMPREPNDRIDGVAIAWRGVSASVRRMRCTYRRWGACLRRR